jgi:hypothetical protein
MKSIFATRTFWIAAIQAVVAVVVTFATQYPDVGWLLFLKSILDIVVRLYTSRPAYLTP